MRKARFVEATIACLQRHGFQGTSIRKICAEAGVSIGLLNHHYTGKDELVAEAYLEVTRRIGALLREALDAQPGDARARLSAYFRASFCAELLNPRLLYAYLAFWGAVKSAETIRRAHEASFSEYRALLARTLCLLAEEQRWRAFDAELAAISLNALLDGLWLEYGLNPHTFSPEQGVQACEAWVDGLVAGAHRRFSSRG